jgi:hypothetical protein
MEKLVGNVHVKQAHAVDDYARGDGRACHDRDVEDPRDAGVDAESIAALRDTCRVNNKRSTKVEVPWMNGFACISSAPQPKRQPLALSNRDKLWCSKCPVKPPGSRLLVLA